MQSVLTMSFQSKIVIVTGAGSGIGAATAKIFAKEDAKVIGVDKNEETLRETAEICVIKGNSIHFIVSDVANDNDCERIINETIEKYGKLDVLVNAAGMVRLGTILDRTILKSFDDVININLRAIIQLTSLAAPFLVKTKGNIVNISSIGDTIHPAPFIAYCVTKAGVTHFTKAAATELGPSGVRVNAICPGTVRTRLLDDVLDPDFDDYSKSTILGKVVEPEEIADMVVYLASDKAKSITGSALVVDNGTLLKRA